MYLDRSLALGGGSEADTADINAHDFCPEALPPSCPPRVHLLYRPGHYDILYPTSA